MLMPKKIKYRKVHRGSLKGESKGAKSVAFGDFGLKVVEPSWITAAQIEAVRITLSRKLRKEGKFYLRVFPDKPITKKPAETRMGKGKGAPEFWVAVAKRERVIFEIGGVTEEKAKEIFRLVSCKLPMKTRFVNGGDKNDE